MLSFSYDVKPLVLHLQEPLSVYQYENVITFGGCFQDLMIVVDREAVRKDDRRTQKEKSHRLLFSMSKHLVR